MEHISICLVCGDFLNLARFVFFVNTELGCVGLCKHCGNKAFPKQDFLNN